MKGKPRPPTKAELAARAAALEQARLDALEVGEDLARVIPVLESIAHRLWGIDRQSDWPAMYEAWKLAGECLRQVRVTFPQAGLLNALHQLLDADPAWSHPSQVLARPRPDYRELAKLAQSRPKSVRGTSRGQLEKVARKLEDAAKLEETARRRRKGGRLQDRVNGGGKS